MLNYIVVPTKMYFENFSQYQYDPILICIDLVGGQNWKQNAPKRDSNMQQICIAGALQGLQLLPVI